MKLPKSYRLSPETVTDLDELVTLYQKELTEKGMKINVSPATVIESLVSEKMKMLEEGNNLRIGKLKNNNRYENTMNNFGGKK